MFAIPFYILFHLYLCFNMIINVIYILEQYKQWQIPFIFILLVWKEYQRNKMWKVKKNIKDNIGILNIGVFKYQYIRILNLSNVI